MILSVVGARPQFIKAAVVSRAFSAIGVKECLVHTGQHYDEAMSGRILTELGINNLSANLKCGSGSQAVQTAEIMVRFEKLILETGGITAVLVYGDTNSSIAAALVASKLHIPVIHVEAGLRSFNRRMPEEINRVVVDHLSELLFCSSGEGVQQLASEGICQSVEDVGDVMLDAFQTYLPAARRQFDSTCFESPFAVVTIHRPSNTDEPERLQAIIDQLKRCDLRFYWPVHPRIKDRLAGMELPDNIVVTEPFSYLKMLSALAHCECVITDSGGLQKETYWAKKRCITARAETEWVETLDGNWNQLWDASVTALSDLIFTQPLTPWVPLYGTGIASNIIAQRVKTHFSL